MTGYIIKVGKRIFATNADNLMDAEEKFINQFPEFEESKLTIQEIETINNLSKEIVEF